MKRVDGIAYREAGPAEGAAGTALFVHGYPESSYMWRHVVSALGEIGWRAVAPDLPGFGDSPPDPPGTWERQVDALEHFRSAVGIDRAALIVHDWGGLIGLRWACEHPGLITALVVSQTGFWSDAQWHELARLLRTETAGEDAMRHVRREVFDSMIRRSCPSMDDATLDEYFKAFQTEEQRLNHLELWRSGDFAKIAPYEGCLTALDVPALVLWGDREEWAPIGNADRFHRELPRSELVKLEDTGHFLFDERPAETAGAITRFLERSL